MKQLISFITGTLITTILYFLGGLDIALQTLLTFIVLDYVTGVLRAFFDKKLNSKIGFKGIIKKIGYLFIVALSVKIDSIAGNTGAIRGVVIYFFVANEGLSIIENWAGMGLPIPQIIVDSLEQLKSGNKKEVEKK